MKAILLAGGGGTRLWPLSTWNEPKPFVKLPGQRLTLFQKTVQRVATLVSPADMVVSAHEAYEIYIRSQLAQIDIDADAIEIFSEPVSKNTLPAVYAAVRNLAEQGGDPTVAVFPCDHILEDESSWKNRILQSRHICRDHPVLFGVLPDRPHTEYGYIDPGDPVAHGNMVRAFYEKPTKSEAKDYIKRGFFWNTGMLLVRASLFLRLVLEHAPQIVQAFDGKQTKEGFALVKEGISIDRGVLEKCSDAVVVPLPVKWSDMGGYEAIYERLDKDAAGNAVQDEHHLVDCTNNLVITSDAKKVLCMGVHDLVIVEKANRIFICPKDRLHTLPEVLQSLDDDMIKP